MTELRGTLEKADVVIEGTPLFTLQVEVDMSQISNADLFKDQPVTVEGKFELVNKLNRPGVWEFKVDKISLTSTASPGLPTELE